MAQDINQLKVVLAEQKRTNKRLAEQLGKDPASVSKCCTIETYEERTYFLIDIPCHPDFIKEQFILNKDVVKDVVKELSERQKVIIEMISADPFLSAKTISEKISEKISEQNYQNASYLYWN